MAEEKKEEPKVELTKQELQNISQLLFDGHFGFSDKETRQVIHPIINKIASVIDSMK